MRFCELWLVCFLLWEGNPTLTRADTVYKKTVGRELSVICSSHKNLTVSRRIFCKNDCGAEDILVETSGSRQENGRYRIKHEKKGSPQVDFITVTISSLTLSDSGRYRCFWDRPVQSSYCEFMIEVTEEEQKGPKTVVYTAAEGEDYTRSCWFYDSGNKKIFCRNKCSEEDILVETTGDRQNGRYRIKYTKHSEDLSFMYVTITNVTRSDSGAYQCHLDKNSEKFWIEVTAAAPFTVSPSGSPPEQGTVGHTDLWFLVSVTLIPVCVALMITAVSLIVCRQRTNRRAQGTAVSRGVSKPEGRSASEDHTYQSLALHHMDQIYSDLQVQLQDH